jgi:hypothetical protein
MLARACSNLLDYNIFSSRLRMRERRRSALLFSRLAYTEWPIPSLAEEVTPLPSSYGEWGQEGDRISRL